MRIRRISALPIRSSSLLTKRSGAISQILSSIIFRFKSESLEIQILKYRCAQDAFFTQ